MSRTDIHLEISLLGELRFQPFPRPMHEKTAVVFMIQRFLLYNSEGTLKNFVACTVGMLMLMLHDALVINRCSDMHMSVSACHCGTTQQTVQEALMKTASMLAAHSGPDTR